MYPYACIQLRLDTSVSIKIYITVYKELNMTSHTDLIRIDEVKKITTLKTSTIFKHIRIGLFPKPYKLLPKLNVWKKQEIFDWLEQKAQVN